MANLVNSRKFQDIKLPPHSIEAEQSVIGALMLDNTSWDKIADLLNQNDFYKADHKLIYSQIVLLIQENKPADVITVKDRLESLDKLDEAGGLIYLGELTQNVPSSSNIRRYAEIVKERSIMRRLVSVSNEIADSAITTQGKDANQILDEAESKIFSISEEGERGRQGFQDIEPVLTEVIKRVDTLYKQDNRSEVTGVPSSFMDLDKKTSGFQDGDLIIIAGRPSMGKTALSLNIAEHVALEQGLPVGIFSMEMSATQLVLRMLGSTGGIDQHKLRTGSLHNDDWGSLTDAIGKLEKAPIHIDETAALNALELKARSRRLYRQYDGLGLIIIDYLQLMTAVSSGENRATEISEISRSLKALAKELNVPIIALSQLNRSLEQRPNKRPVMSDLRESGAIEQDADLILFIYRDEVYNPETEDKGKAEIIIGKQRNGPIGTIPLTFKGELTKFGNYINPNKY